MSAEQELRRTEWKEARRQVEGPEMQNERAKGGV